jgi:hypothetical protein
MKFGTQAEKHMLKSNNAKRGSTAISQDVRRRHLGNQCDAIKRARIAQF